MKKRYLPRPARPQLPSNSSARKGPARMGRLLLALFALLGVSGGARAQRLDSPFFRADAEAKAAAATSPLAAALFHSQALTLDLASLRAALVTAPLETKAGAAPLVLALPLPDGHLGRFAVREAPIMEPALAARFPAIKTYAGVGLDDAAASVRLDVTPMGFHAQVLTANGNSFYIDPMSRTDVRHYLGFYKKDMNRAAAGAALTCGFDAKQDAPKAKAGRPAAAASRATALLSSGPQLRTYRLALACTPQYALTKGNTVAGVMAGEATTVNRVVGVYEKELAVRLVLIANNDQLIFLDGGTPPPTPYSNGNGNAMLGQNQSNITAIIGAANYDIGHVVSTGGGGVAYLGVVCDNANKARGVTGSRTPVGDSFDIDYVAHEMGHQFGGNHTFNNDDSGSCAGNREADVAYEPGSGSTIMAYAGICGSPNNLQPNSDPIFHTANYQEMRAFIDGTTCSVNSATGNTAPVVTAVPASGKVLPIGTPFKLTASATDAENDALTYMWEELDLGPAGSPNATQVPGQAIPLFRSFTPNSSPTRYFPRLISLVNNTTVLGERLPTVTRPLNFRCTVRDEHNGLVGVIGGVNYSSTVSLSSSATAGPFVVQAPNTGVTWVGGAAQTVTWDVAGTDAAPVSCAVVNIRLSLDGGLTYPTVLAQNVPNNGAAVVVAPSPATAQTQARIMVEAADNYFFDISDANFTISPPAVGPTITSFTPTGGMPGTVVSILGSNFTGATAVAFNGTPAASFAVVSATQLTATVAASTTTGPITVATPVGTATSATPFVVGAPPTITGFTPVTGPVGTVVVITGTNFTGATQVRFNTTAAVTFAVNSATQITATVPAGATTGYISVTTPVNTAVSSAVFTVIQPPTITSFTPTSGRAGTVVVLTGTNFLGATQVTFNGTAAPAFTINSATQLTATAPVGVSTGPICVTGPGGQGCSATSFGLAPANDLCADAIAIACGQSVTGSTVNATDAGDPTGNCVADIDAGGVFYTIVGTGNNLTVSTCNAGTNFDTKLFVYSGACGAYVCVGGNDDASNCNSNGGVSSTVTFASVLGETYRIFVTGYDGEEGTFVLRATCSASAPTITQISPNSGPEGTTVTITGTNFTGATAASFNGLRGTSFTVVNATTITVVVPTGATTGDVYLSSPNGASNGSLFTVTPLSATANANQSTFSVWPNPIAAKGTLHLTLALPARSASLTLRNVLGQTVTTRSFSGSSTELSTTGLATGTYLLTVQTEGRAPSIQRVVVE
ncbi:reprolysin-like metallopeptidase [Hymenobacter ruricola]|uniref:IPT/TIG domain-containing protein n=1 Tax=Hymenobacter ruricola TaxID=2791023 RepID=A0ABS0I009_9BACT|nr:IPT/TIG domain-containing protein [Hymenobacter ruricola]MBF9220237.1 IPT/TIG domain-containing protein [Hymenobacter ruricola]